MELARKKGVPPYVIFSDKTIREMSALKPVDNVAFLRVSGVGETKLEQYGALFYSEDTGVSGVLNTGSPP